MTPQRHEEIRQIFLEAVSKPQEQRAAFVASRSRGDDALRKEVELLLAHHVELDESQEESDDEESEKIRVNETDQGPSFPVPKSPAENETPSDFAAGDMIAQRYRIQCKLGAGGAGVVYRADDVILKCPVAIKFLTSGTSNPRTGERFRSEVRLSRKVSHRNVCRVFDIGESDGRVFLTMEFCDGEDLGRLIRRVGRLSQESGCEIARQICTGLAAAHGAGVLHRDLKPSNILLDADGRVLITDFGVAAVVGASRASDLTGTPGYMSPEQIIGVGVDERSDIYSLGLVFYELFSGKPAYREASVAAYLEAQLTTPPSPISTVLPGTDPDIERLIHRCLARDRDERPESALAVAASLPGVDALSVALQAHQTASPSLVGDSTEAARRLRRPAIWAAIALLGLIALPILRHWAAFPWDARDSRSPSVLLNIAQEVTGSIESDSAPHSAYGFCSRFRARSLLEDFAGTIPEGLVLGTNQNLLFWYRSGDAALVPQTVETLIFGPGNATANDPSFGAADRNLVLLEPSGRPVAFIHRKETSGQTGSGTPADAIAAAAKLEPSGESVVWTHFPALRDCEGRSAGEHTSLVTCREEKLSLALIMEPHDKVSDPIDDFAIQLRKKVVKSSMRLLFIVAALLCTPLALKNLLQLRCDIRGASRLFFFFLIVSLVSWLLRATHGGSVESEIVLVSVALIRGLGLAALVTVFYLALEPVARKFWPHLLITWTRLLQGRNLAAVGWQHVLAGVSAGCVVAALYALDYAAVRRGMGLAVEPLFAHQFSQRIIGVGSALSGACISAKTAVGQGLLIVLLLTLGRWLFGTTGRAVVLPAFVVLFFLVLHGAGLFLSTVFWAACVAAVMLWVGVRFGLLALVLMLLVANLLHATPMSMSTDAWTFPQTAAVIGGVVIVLAVAYSKGRRVAGASGI